MPAEVRVPPITNFMLLFFSSRAAFLAFCNHSESRRLFVYLLPDQSGNCAEGVGQIRVSAKPPRILSDKALFFLKCGHASKLNRESMGVDVVYSECSNVPISKSLNLSTMTFAEHQFKPFYPFI